MELLVILAIIFFAFIGLAPKEVAQIFLSGCWALMILAMIVSTVYQVLR
jgi:hypothetical protein